MLTMEQSERLKILRFPLIMGVIFIHAAVFDIKATGNDVCIYHLSFLARTLISYTSHSLGRVCVPLFFLISSYFLFLKLKPEVDSYKAQINKRFKSLIVPYFFWNFLVLICYIIIEKTPELSVFLSAGREKITENGAWFCFKALTGLTEYPIAYQFWFIRNLFVLCLMSPLFFLLNNNTARFLFFIFTVTLWFCGVYPLVMESLLFFYFGFILSKRRNWMSILDENKKWVLFLFLIFSTLDALTECEKYNLIIHKISIMTGCAFLLQITYPFTLKGKAKNILLWLSRTSFFVYATHEPTLTIIRKIIYRLSRPETSLSVTLVYILSIFLTVLICLMLYVVSKKTYPQITNLITGGRT